jgi:O-antigen ligase/tetratricopeptide (TPR) repeat protein
MEKRTTLHYSALFFSVLFLAVHFIPDAGSLEVNGPQWLYLGIIGIISHTYILFRRNDYSAGISDLLSSYTFILFSIFVLWSGISIGFALNKPEALIGVAKHLTVLTGISAIFILWRPCNIRNLFVDLSVIITGILIFESVQTIAGFFQNLGKVKLDANILKLAGNYGNKNFLATSLLIKVPMAIFLTFRISKRPLMLLGLAGLLLGSTAIVILNTRTTLIGLGLVAILFMIGQGLTFVQNLNKRALWASLIVFFLAVPSGLFFANYYLSKEAAKQPNAAGEYGTVTKRLNDVVLDTKQASRLNLWANSIKSAKKYGPWGVGTGNNKLVAMEFDRYYYNDVRFSLHVHNDFLETLVELGIPGVLLYTAFFISLFLIIARAVRRDPDTMWLALTVLMMFTIYLLDAVVSFPMDRAINQCLFVMITALVLQFSHVTDNGMARLMNRRKTAVAPAFSILSVLILLPAVWFSSLHLKSLMVQRVIYQDIIDNEEVFSAPLKTVLTLPDFPNLVLGCVPANGLRAEYLIANNKPDEALAELNKFPELNRYSNHCDNLRSVVFESRGQADSAYYYSHKAFFSYPRVLPYYKRFLRSCVLKADTASMGQAFRLIHRFRPQGTVVDAYLKGMQDVVKGNDPRLDSLLEVAILKYPADSVLFRETKRLFMRNGWIKSNDADANDYASQAVVCFRENNFQKAANLWIKSAEKEPDVVSHQENIGICFIKMNQFAKAIPYLNKVVTMGGRNQNGKTEFLLGISYIGLDDKKNGCKFLSKASGFGYPDARKYIEIYCK